MYHNKGCCYFSVGWCLSVWSAQIICETINVTFQLKWLERNTMLHPLYHTCYVLWILLVILGFNCVWFTSQDKILQSFSKAEEIQVTNDGATILKSIGVDNPAAKILVGKWGSSIINLFKKVVALKIYMIS